MSCAVTGGRIFLSHASTDAGEAREVADALRARGLEPILDRERVAPGESFVAFIERSLATSDYCLLLWSRAASAAGWVRLEWEAAIHRAVREARAFLVACRIEDCPLPELLRPRLAVDLFPTLEPGLSSLIDVWRTDREAERRSGRPVAGAVAEPAHPEADTVYVTSEYFELTVPVRTRLEAPAGVLVHQLVTRLSLPTRMTHAGRLGVAFEYRLLHDRHPLSAHVPMAHQGVRPADVLWLEFDLVPFSDKPPKKGRLTVATFRSSDGSEPDGTEGWIEAQRAAEELLRSRFRAVGRRS